jgi:deoxyribodipyrimidine photolyase-related protein
MLLNMFNPKDVLKWYISVVSIDAYDWVMEPNVYGMSQFSVGNLMMTRPYFSSSNYIDKMSSFKKQKNVYNKIKLAEEEYEWFEIWDILYYYFIYKNKTYLAKNYATANAVKNWNNKSKNEKNKIIKLAKNYLKIY